MFSKVVNVSTPISHIRNNSVIAISGFNMATTPEYLILELYKSYSHVGSPNNLFIISDALPAVPGRALDIVAQSLYHDPNQQFLKGALMPFLGFSPWLQKLVSEDRIECYGWPIGITAYWFREVSSGRPGLLTKIGVDTFLDPRREGAALNERGKKSRSCKVSIVDISGEEYLLYQAPKPDYALIRATTADETGNLSMEDEGTRGTVLSIAQAAKAGPKKGTVMAQVRWLTKSWTINPREVDIPSPLVDFVVVSPKEYHTQGGTIEYDPSISYRIVPPITDRLINAVTIGEKKEYEHIIARRILLELIKIFEEKNAPVLVNLGIGIPALVSLVAAEEEVTEFIVTVLESGQWGGIALSGTDFGLAVSPFALSTIPDMFSNFEGGIIDVASLGFLQVDKEGNVNPSILPHRIFGPGGFPVIAGGAPITYFAGAFMGGETKINIVQNNLNIIQDGTIPKFVDEVFKVVFSGKQAIKFQKEILYVTERAVFRLTRKGLVLEEIAPGIELDKDVLSKMKFKPIIKSSVGTMDEKLFREGKMGLRDEIIKIFKR
jgi:acyl CoA:acetate/3-ketoacid CoA transferase